MKLKKILALACSTMLALTTLTSCGSKKKTNDDSKYKIGIVQIQEHDSLNTIRDAVISQLEVLGYKDGKNCTIDTKQANGEPSTATTIVQNFEAQEMDIIVAIATPTAQAALPYSEKIPVVFSAVNNPVFAGLVDSLESTGRNVTGTSDKLAISKILDFAFKITPDVKTLGYLYNTGEANSVACLEEVKEYLDGKDIKLEIAAVTNSSEVQQAVQTLCSKVDAIFTPNDNTVAGAMGVVAQIADEEKIPVYVGADSMVNDGGFATVGIQYSDLGKETANMVDQILKGEKKASEIPVKVFNDDLSVFINKSTADAIGVTIPDDIANDEKTIFLGK